MGHPKFQYSSLQRKSTTPGAQKLQKTLWETDLQSLEKKIVCDKRDFGETTTVLLAPCVPEVGIFMRKISCRYWDPPEGRAPSNNIPATRSPAYCLIRSKTSFSSRRAPQQQAQPQLDRSPRLAQQSPRKLSLDPAGQPAIAKNTSRTKSPMAMSLNRDAWGRVGQSWFAAQKRKAVANRMVLTSSATGRRCAN